MTDVSPSKKELTKYDKVQAAHKTKTSSRTGVASELVRLPTTSFLTTAMLVYAIGAGITAAAGTRLALQWFLDKVFRLFS